MNAQISDKFLARQVQALRIEATLRQRVMAQLTLLEHEVVSSLKSHDPTQWALLSRRRREVRQWIAEEIDPLVQERYERIAAFLDAALMRLATNEAAATQGIVNDATTQALIEEQPSQTQLRAGVILGLFPSAAKPTDRATVGREWWIRQGQSLSQRLGDSLTVGVALEENLTALARRIKGTPDLGFADGIIAKAKRDAEVLLRTQATHTLNEARVATAERNAVKQLILIHQSVLDSRTSNICLSRHGLMYTADDDHTPIGHSIPYLTGPPYHPSCRSTMVPAERDGGTIPHEDASAWLRRRDTAYQDQVLGPSRGKLFRAGKLTTRQLIDMMTGKPLTLEELGA